jgi:hypothetical protein
MVGGEAMQLLIIESKHESLLRDRRATPHIVGLAAVDGERRRPRSWRPTLAVEPAGRARSREGETPAGVRPG